jgi:hypothetical protein
MVANATGEMRLHFFCQFEKDDFVKLMADVVEETRRRMDEISNCTDLSETDGRRLQTLLQFQESGDSDGEWRCSFPGKPTITIVYTCGDAEKVPDLEAIMRENEYDEALLLPPVGEEYTPQAQDTWLMSVMLMIRFFQDKMERERPIHIIAENALDATSKLALAPKLRNMNRAKKCGRGGNPDFVNIHSITARALSQVAAYPDIAPVLRDLYSTDVGEPIMLLVRAEMFGLVGVGKLSFANVTRRVRMMRPQQGGDGMGNTPDAILGWRSVDGVVTMPPCQSDTREFEAGDNVILMTRCATSAAAYEEMLRDAMERAKSVVNGGLSSE